MQHWYSLAFNTMHHPAAGPAPAAPLRKADNEKNGPLHSPISIYMLCRLFQTVRVNKNSIKELPV